ncbi:reactive intermediate/imine deaminase [Candidatus Woesearchaeota archaeon]|nr:reactive intermediate/imine deaminase [Candidatus Woesearchaeota archaeon]
MTRKVIQSLHAPKATGPFSQAKLYNDSHVMELSGQVGINPESGRLVEGGVGPETEQVLSNIKAILKEVGWDFNNIVKARIYLTDMKDYQVVNEIYGRSFTLEPPARVAIAVKQLPLGALVEIECTATGENIKA